MTIITSRAEWPGLPAVHDRTVHYPRVLVAMADEFRRQAHHFDADGPGGLRTITAVTAYFAEPVSKTYGPGYTAEALRDMHRDASGHAISVYEAILANLDAAATRLDAVAEQYRHIGREIEARFRGIVQHTHHGPYGYGEVREWQPSAATERWTPTPRAPAETTIPDVRRTGRILPDATSRMSGGLSVVTAALPPETARMHHPVELADGMRRIQKAHAWELHHRVGKAWRDVADALDLLCAKIHAIAGELSGSWSGPAAGRAQFAFRDIHGTARSLEIFARSMSVHSRESGSALEEVVAPVRLGRPMTRSGRETAVEDAFDRLIARYRELLLQPMQALSYDLPFGALRHAANPARRVPIRSAGQPPSRHEAPPAAQPPRQMAVVDSVAPPVIGGSLPTIHDAVWSADLSWVDPGGWTPPVIG